MAQSYSQFKALWAITRASFKAIFKQPASIIFSLLFPIVFILIFGAFSNGGAGSQPIAIIPGSDTTNALFDSIKANPFIRISALKDTAQMRDAIERGNLTAMLKIEKVSVDSFNSYKVKVIATSASGSNLGELLQQLDYLAMKTELDEAHISERHYHLQPMVYEGRKYRRIDFILPGQLGFSILFATLFGIAITFFNLREQLVLKRFYATPVKKINILIGIGASRLFFQVVNVLVLILFGYFFLNFTLVHGVVTVIEMLLLTMVMLFLLMGVGLIISSVAKSDAIIPLLINIFGFPQMLLSGTFFPIEVFPKWLQDLCQALPLTQFNNAMRKISFDGLHLFDCWKELGILGIWVAVTYLVVNKVMKWE